LKAYEVKGQGSVRCPLFVWIPDVDDLIILGFGWAGAFHLIDPTTGVATVFGMQILPTMDGDILKASLDFEQALYAGLA
jgi:hypothetical protein